MGDSLTWWLAIITRKASHHHRMLAVWAVSNSLLHAKVAFPLATGADLETIMAAIQADSTDLVTSSQSMLQICVAFLCADVLCFLISGAGVLHRTHAFLLTLRRANRWVF